jgi:hypothetical protein
MEPTQQAREGFEQQRKESAQRIQELLEARATSEAARVRGVRSALDEMQQHTEPVVI